MDPYVFAVLERNAQEARVRAAPHTWHLHEALAERSDDRRTRRLATVHAVLGWLRSHAAGRRVPADAGGRT
jgi:hypothetical protein